MPSLAPAFGSNLSTGSFVKCSPSADSAMLNASGGSVVTGSPWSSVTLTYAFTCCRSSRPELSICARLTVMACAAPAASVSREIRMKSLFLCLVMAVSLIRIYRRSWRTRS